MKGHERGFALVTALWALVIVGAFAAAYLGESRRLVRVSANRNAEFQAREAALAGLAVADNELERLHVRTLDPTAALVGFAAWNRLDSAFARSAHGCLGAGCYDFQVRDLGAYLNVNVASQEQLRALLLALDLDHDRAEGVAAAVADWVDPDDEPRTHGAERDYYGSLPVPDAPRNGPLTALDELRRVRGMDEPLFKLVTPYLTVEGDGRVNLNTAPAPVIAALPGMSPQAARVITDHRARGALFANLFEVLQRVGPRTRGDLQKRFADLVQLTIFEPQRIEVTSVGWAAGQGARIPLRAVYFRSSDRVVFVKQSRLDL